MLRGLQVCAGVVTTAHIQRPPTTVPLAALSIAASITRSTSTPASSGTGGGEPVRIARSRLLVERHVAAGLGLDRLDVLTSADHPHPEAAPRRTPPSRRSRPQRILHVEPPLHERAARPERLKRGPGAAAVCDIHR